MVGCQTVEIVTTYAIQIRSESLWAGFEAFKARKSLESDLNLSSP